ncbi:MAG TPA: OmpA family protein [Candidatus Eisenbacteria bacterium]|nr:OmpA family protein [Candidatus Eisenbacteria bacterium]
MKDLNSVTGWSLVALALLGLPGCLATRNWVKEQMDPVSARVGESENRLNQAESQIGSLGGRISGVEGKLGQFEGRLGQVDAKAEKALNSLANLRLERKFVIDLREGANFGFNSATLPADAKKEIDGFLSDLKGDPAGMEGAIFLIAGHTDSVGSEDYNYELGRRRAEGVARYLITQKKIDPLRVVTVSYGETSPAVENKTAKDRAKNRRVEVLVYREGITSAPPADAAATSPATPNVQGRSQPEGETLSKR